MIGVSDRVNSVAHVIQIALTPVFLFSGIASLLGVLSTRLGRVADHVDALSEKVETGDRREGARYARRLAYLKQRTQILDLAVILATLGGALTLAAALLLFVDGLREHAGVSLFIAFGLALLSTVCALLCFLGEMLLASRGIRHEAAESAEESTEGAEPADAPDDERAESAAAPSP